MVGMWLKMLLQKSTRLFTNAFTSVFVVLTVTVIVILAIVAKDDETSAR